MGGELDRMGHRKRRHLHPMMIEELMHMTKPGDPMGLLAMIGLFREDMPWLYELGIELYRAIQRGNATQIRKAGNLFHQALESTTRGPLARELQDRETFYFFRESGDLFHRYVEAVIDQAEKRTTKRKVSRKRKVT